MVKNKDKKVITRNSEKLLVRKNERITATYANFPISQKLKKSKNFAITRIRNTKYWYI